MVKFLLEINASASAERSQALIDVTSNSWAINMSTNPKYPSEIARLLLAARADIHSQGDSAIELAVTNPDVSPDLVRVLLSANADLTTIKDTLASGGYVDDTAEHIRKLLPGL